MEKSFASSLFVPPNPYRPFTMGVPYFMAWLAKRYPLIAKRMNWASFPKFHCFFVDFNCIIHEGMRKTKAIDDDLDQREIMTEVFRYLDTLVRVIKPQNLLFISVDGPAPLAKCVEQRKRRFKRAKVIQPGKFDANAISVGTQFMEDLNRRLEEFIKDRMKNDPIWGRPKIVYATHRTPGEGEHKFFDFIRAQQKAGVWKEDATCCVYSPDADLVFICLQSRVEHFCILRESDKIFPEIQIKGESNDTGLRMGHNDFVLVYVDLLKQYLMFDCQVEKEIAPRLFDDFAAITYLIGNDFITKLPDMCADSGDLTTIMDVYFREFARRERFLVDNDRFVPELLREFLQHAEMAVRKSRNKQGDLDTFAKTRMRQMYPTEFALNPSEIERKVCCAVIDSYYWVLKYYKYGCPSWDWYFPYEHAPTAWMVAKWADHIPEFVEGTPPDPLVQLMAILPKENKDFLPQPLQPYLESYELSSPVTFNIEYARSKVAMHKEEFTPSETTRNTIVQPYLLTYSKGKLCCESVDYEKIDIGDIEPCFIPTLFGPGRPTRADRPQRGVRETLILEHSIPFNEKAAGSVIGKTILVGWPHLLPALVVGIKRDKDPALIQQYRTIFGLDIEQSNVIVQAKPLMYGDINELTFTWASNPMSFPLSLTAPLWATNLYKNFSPLSWRPIKDIDPDELAYDKQSHSLIRVTKVEDDFVMGAKVNIPSMHRFTAILRDDHTFWIPFETLCKQYNISESFMQSILSSIETAKYHINIGLKCIQQKKALVGYIRSNRNKLMVTQDFHRYLDEYFQYTGTLLRILQARDGKSIMEKVDSYIDAVGEDRAKEIRSWVKANGPAAHSPMGKMYMFTLSARALQQYEEDVIGNPYQPRIADGEERYDKSSLVWRGCYRPISQEIKFGARVVVVSQSGVVPFGTPGVVIMKSFQGRVVHVIADNEFELGNRLFGRLRTKRGLVLPVTDVAPL